MIRQQNLSNNPDEDDVADSPMTWYIGFRSAGPQSRIGLVDKGLPTSTT